MFNSLSGGVVIAIAALALVGPATADDPAKKPTPCPFVRSIDNFSVVDNYTAIIETGPSHRYKVTFVNSCRELKWAWYARVEARPGICLSKGDVLVVGNNGFVDRCFINSIERLPPKNAQTPASY
jgi:hypothetical protein